jgi:fructokinase
MVAVCLGEIVVDWLCAEPVDSFAEAGMFLRSPGGNASNVAVGLRRLGVAARLVGKIGSDIHGRYLADFFAAEGVDIEFVCVDPDRPTAQCYVLTGRDGEHTFYNWPQPHAADMLAAGDVAPGALDGAGLLHATGISLVLDPRRTAVLTTMESARQRGLVVSFDACFPSGKSSEARKPVETAMGLAHILKVNERELALWCGAPAGTPVNEMTDVLFEKYRPVALAVTLAEKGSLIRTATAVGACKAFSVAPVNGVGAGDAFAAGLLKALSTAVGADLSPGTLARLSPDDWQRAGTYANAVGALACRSLSASAGLPHEAEVQALMG